MNIIPLMLYAHGALAILVLCVVAGYFMCRVDMDRSVSAVFPFRRFFAAAVMICVLTIIMTVLAYHYPIGLCI